jgi:hypothetical protein
MADTNSPAEKSAISPSKRVFHPAGPVAPMGAGPAFFCHDKHEQRSRVILSAEDFAIFCRIQKRQPHLDNVNLIRAARYDFNVMVRCRRMGVAEEMETHEYFARCLIDRKDAGVDLPVLA